MNIQVLIGGDVCPVGRDLSLFREGNASSLLDDLLLEFQRADLSIVNLECPLIGKDTPIDKVGPILGAPRECVNGLIAMGVDIVGLANNHILDHGAEGLESTIDAIEREGMAHVGAGRDLSEARRILIREVKGVRVGILAIAEREFNIASAKEPGANPMDAIDVVRNIRGHSAEYDYLIVLFHGGNEYYRFPRPGLVDTCHFLVEQGANAVICQHSHCVGCLETYHGVPIVYGQGNFLFDMPSTSTSWHEGSLVQLTFRLNEKPELRLVPFWQARNTPGARRMSRQEEAAWRQALNERSRELENPLLLEARWGEFCQHMKRQYLHTLHGKPGLVRRVLGKLDLLHVLDGPQQQLARLNVIRCESHREALSTILESEAAKQMSKETSKKRVA